MLEAIVFDMDGLMVDSEPLARQAWDTVLHGYGRSLDDRTYHQMIGLRRDDSVAVVQGAFSLPVSNEALRQQIEAAAAAVRAQGIPAMPGLKRLLEEIRRHALPWAVATSSVRIHAEEVLAQLGLTAECQAIAAGDEVRRGKPAPDIYLLAAERLGVPASLCLALEDSLPGSRAAVAAGMVTIAVPGPHANSEDFEHTNYVFRSLGDVADDLDRLLKS